MTLYQIENLKSSRRVRVSKAYNPKAGVYEWGCDCGSDGSYLTEKEVARAEKQLSIRYYNDGDCFLHTFEVKPEIQILDERPAKKKTKKKAKLDDLDFGWEDENK